MAGTLALLCIFLLWHQSRRFSDASDLHDTKFSNPAPSRPENADTPPPQSEYAGYNPSYLEPAEHGDADFDPPAPASPPTVTTTTMPPATGWTPSHIHEADQELLADALRYVKAIMDPEDDTFHRLQCPKPSTSRYGYLRDLSATTPSKRTYYFALNLHKCAPLLPRLLGSIVEAIRFLGPSNCALSILEGRSSDGTYEILKTLQTEIEGLGAIYYFDSSEINPVEEGNDRIVKLAELRNLAVQPLISNPQLFSETDTTVLFINDVAICAEDILELIHQRRHQNADMTCAMDWIFSGTSFYDVWVSRGMNGDQFFEIPQDGSWDFNGNLFWNNPQTKARLEAKVPFQVFSCWNGAVAFTAAPLLKKEIQFRSAYQDRGECYLGEPTHFCKDLWYHGYGKIAVVPSVNLGYDDEQGLASKQRNGWTGRTVEQVENTQSGGGQGDLAEPIVWKNKPPELIKCVPTYQQPTWVRWDQSLNEPTS